MGLMKRFILLSLCFLTFLSPIKSETKENKEYSKYSFYSECLDKSQLKMNNGLVIGCSLQAKAKLDALIAIRINSKGKCYGIYASHACTLKKSQEAFEKYVNATCKENRYGGHYEYCEMMLKKDRLKWLDKTLGA